MGWERQKVTTPHPSWLLTQLHGISLALSVTLFTPAALLLIAWFLSAFNIVKVNIDCQLKRI